MVSAPTWAESRFLDRLWIDDVVIGDRDSCWTWNAAHDPNGYARCGRVLVHRLVADVCAFSAPHIHHVCENPSCINPAHLEPLDRQADHTARHIKTACSRGHPFDERNTLVLKSGWRRCRTCHRDRQRHYNAKGIAKC